MCLQLLFVQIKAQKIHFQHLYCENFFQAGLLGLESSQKSLLALFFPLRAEVQYRASKAIKLASETSKGLSLPIIGNIPWPSQPGSYLFTGPDELRTGFHTSLRSYEKFPDSRKPGRNVWELGSCGTPCSGSCAPSLWFQDIGSKLWSLGKSG